MEAVVKETAGIEEQSSDIMVYAEAAEIQSLEGLEQGKVWIQTIKALRKEVNATFDPVVDAAHKAHKEAVAARKKHVEPLDAAERLIKGKIGGYLDYVEEERRKEAAREMETARKEREKALAAAGRRIDKLTEKGASIQKQVDVLSTELNDPELTDVEEEVMRARLEILEAQAEGNTEAVEVKRAEVAETNVVPMPVPTSAPPKVKGMSTRVKKVPTVVNPMALVKAVASGKIPEGVITFDMKAIEKLVNAGMTLPGVSVRSERSVSVR